MSTQLETRSASELITNDLYVAGQTANEYAARNTFHDYVLRKAPSTRRAQRADLATFADYLAEVGIGRDPDRMQTDPAAWMGVTWGLVEGFVKWLAATGYATGTISRKLSTIKVYAKLALKAGTIGSEEATRIATVTSFHGKEARRIDEVRTVTRIGDKKAKHIPLSAEQVQALKERPHTPQGRRDMLLMCLLLDHGLRVGEVALLTLADFDLKIGELRFYRPKVDIEQTHRLSSDTFRAIHLYIDNGDVPAFADVPILRGSRRGGTLSEAGMTTRAITQRVHTLGKELGVQGLSAHDCRHYWATKWAGKVDLFRLQEAGGWNSLSMPRRYTERAKVANEGMV